jgi:hypothetical protein
VDGRRGALDRQSAPPVVVTTVDAFIDTYVSDDRCPADDLVEETARSAPSRAEDPRPALSFRPITEGMIAR